MALATAALLLPLGAQRPAAVQVVTAFHEGEAVRLEMADPPRARAALQFGPWRLGERRGMGEITDKHPNLYIVCPGTQYVTRGDAQYDHTLLINTVPTTEAAVQWDVVWAVVLDPSLRVDFRDERALLLEAQQTFRPGDLFALSDVPGWAALREVLGVRETRDLLEYEHEGRLPRVILRPAGFSLQAAVQAGPAAPAGQ